MSSRRGNPWHLRALSSLALGTVMTMCGRNARRLRVAPNVTAWRELPGSDIKCDICESKAVAS